MILLVEIRRYIEFLTVILPQAWSCMHASKNGTYLLLVVLSVIVVVPT